MEKKADLWELRHREKVGVVSNIPNCGYSPRQLQQLRQKGYRLYKNGKEVTSRWQS